MGKFEAYSTSIQVEAPFSPSPLSIFPKLFSDSQIAHPSASLHTLLKLAYSLFLSCSCTSEASVSERRKQKERHTHTYGPEHISRCEKIERVRRVCLIACGQRVMSCRYQ